MQPISAQNRSSRQHPGRLKSRAARERLVEQARITQRRLTARRSSEGAVSGHRAAA